MMAKKVQQVLKSTKAKFTLVVEYDECIPSDPEFEEMVDMARQYGSIQVAELEIFSPLKRDFSLI